MSKCKYLNKFNKLKSKRTIGAFAMEDDFNYSGQRGNIVLQHYIDLILTYKVLRKERLVHRSRGDTSVWKHSIAYALFR